MDFVHNGDVNVKPAADLMYIIPMEIGNYSYGIIMYIIPIEIGNYSFGIIMYIIPMEIG